MRYTASDNVIQDILKLICGDGDYYIYEGTSQYLRGVADQMPDGRRVEDIANFILQIEREASFIEIDYEAESL